MSIERDIQFIYEIGCLRNIDRAWKQIIGPDVANLAEHHLRVAWIALILAKHEGVKDTDKILKMALVHDLPESRTGDVHYISRLYTKRDESEAIKDTLHDTSLEQEMQDLWQEYEERKSIEAKIVKDADNLDVDFELHELTSKGHKINERFHPIRKQSVYPRLYTESAKKIWKGLENSDLHDWHVLGKNRHNSGDWSEKIDNLEI